MTNTVKINFENTDIMNLFSNIVDAIAQKIEDYPSIEKVIFNNFCKGEKKIANVVVLWTDGDRTIRYCHEEDEYDPEYGVMLCVLRKMFSSNQYHKYLKMLQENDPKGAFAKEIVLHIDEVGYITNNDVRKLFEALDKPIKEKDTTKLIAESYLNKADKAIIKKALKDYQGFVPAAAQYRSFGQKEKYCEWSDDIYK